MRDRAFFSQSLEVNDFLPVLGAVQNDGHSMAFARLHQSQNLKQFIERAKAAGKDYQRSCTHNQVHFACGKVMEPKAQLRRDVGVRLLFTRQRNR